MRNCASEVWCCAPSRNDAGASLPRHEVKILAPGRRTVGAWPLRALGGVQEVIADDIEQLADFDLRRPDCRAQGLREQTAVGIAVERSLAVLARNIYGTLRQRILCRQCDRSSVLESDTGTGQARPVPLTSSPKSLASRLFYSRTRVPRAVTIPGQRRILDIGKTCTDCETPRPL